MSEQNRREQAIELVYKMLDDHGWADHYRCGLEDGEEQEERRMCGKEWHERQSVAEIVDALHGSGLLA